MCIIESQHNMHYVFGIGTYTHQQAVVNTADICNLCYVIM